MSFIRKSKFRHVFGGIAKRAACYEGLKPSQRILDGSMVAVNQKFVAYIYQTSGGGVISVFPIYQTGRHPNEMPLIKGIQGGVTDLIFNPSNPHILATGAEDSALRIYTIPENGLEGDVNEPTQILKGHGRKPTELWWNPNVAGVIASAGMEPSIRVWDVVNQKALYAIEGKHQDNIQAFQWNETGNLIVTQCRDKKIRVIDVRSNQISTEIASHATIKSARVNWSNQKNWIMSPGFGKGSDREILIWDLKNPSLPIVNHNIDQASGQIQSFFDEGTQILFVATKGESGIRYYEVNNDPPYNHFINNFTEGTPVRGICQFPNLFLHTKTCEIARFYKLTNKNTIEPVSFTVPRRAEIFQEDLYPPQPDTTQPALTVAEWTAGQNKEQKKHIFMAENSGEDFDTPNPAASPGLPSHFPLSASPPPSGMSPEQSSPSPPPQSERLVVAGSVKARVASIASPVVIPVEKEMAPARSIESYLTTPASSSTQDSSSQASSSPPSSSTQASSSPSSYASSAARIADLQAQIAALEAANPRYAAIAAARTMQLEQILKDKDAEIARLQTQLAGTQ